MLLSVCPPVQAATQAEGPGPLEKLRPLIKPSAPDGHLQELAPPLAVQQIQAALADRQPHVTILAPADGSNLTSGNWTLKLLAQDWPLADGGPLGLGPHVVIQIDDQEAIRLTEHRSTPQGDSLQLTLPALAPGSHRITAYAAKPWGESAKNSGAASQIRVDRVAANPLTVPKPGSPQLLPVSPLGVISSEPVLLDWLLLDAPLQHLRDNDGSWRLRISVNGDSFITDQNVPIWLKGWTTGSNSLQLELLDGRGKPLNPPFNSLVSEVVLKPSAPNPRWQLGRLSAEELASLVGQTPTPAQPLPTKPKALEAPIPAPEPPVQPTTKVDPQPKSQAATKVDSQAAVDDPDPEGAGSQPAKPEPSQPEGSQPEAAEPEIESIAPTSVDASERELATTALEGSPDANGDPTQLENDPALAIQPSETNSEINSDDDADQPALLPKRSGEPAGETASPKTNAFPNSDDLAKDEEDPPNSEDIAKAKDIAKAAKLANPDDSPAPRTSEEPDAVIPPPITNPDRLTPSTSVLGSARDQVHEDGSLIKPKRKAPLAGLRERLGA